MVAEKTRLSLEEFRALERANPDAKYEYIDGQVSLMSGGTANHSSIGINVVGVLRDALGDGPCHVYNSDLHARLSPTRVTLPDATVTCDPRDVGEITEIQAPRVVVEVLSDSTEAYDRGEKFGYYQACPTVQEYVLVATRRQAVDVFRRARQGQVWTCQSYAPGSEIELDSIGVRFPLAALYGLTTVPANVPERQDDV